VLENVLYGFYIARTPGAFEVWRSRDENEDAKKQVRREFTTGKMFGALDSVDARTSEIARNLYERTIDLGAHPNQHSVFSSLNVDESADGLAIDTNYLAGNSLPHHLALKSTGQIGVVGLDIMRHVFPQRFAILGVTEGLEHVKQGL
jgi:hypothetical protein